VRTMMQLFGGGSWRAAASPAGESALGTSVDRGGASAQSRQSQNTIICEGLCQDPAAATTRALNHPLRKDRAKRAVN
jgi:hypothetical protein